MNEALIAAGFLVVATIIGALLKPGPDQLKPLTPQASSGDSGHDHGHHSGH
jgi:hypothetical protein